MSYPIEHGSCSGRSTGQIVEAVPDGSRRVYSAVWAYRAAPAQIEGVARAQQQADVVHGRRPLRPGIGDIGPRHTGSAGHVHATITDDFEVAVLKNKGRVLVNADPELTRVVRHGPEQPPEAPAPGARLA